MLLLLLLSLFITADLRSAKRFPARLLYNPYIVSMCETEERGGEQRARRGREERGGEGEGGRGGGDDTLEAAAAFAAFGAAGVGALLAAGAAGAEPRAACMRGMAVDLEAGFSELVWLMT